VFTVWLSGGTGEGGGGRAPPPTAWVGRAECPYYPHTSYNLPACARTIVQMHNLPVGEVKLVGYQDILSAF